MSSFCLKIVKNFKNTEKDSIKINDNSLYRIIFQKYHAGFFRPDYIVKVCVSGQ